ncbi:MAG: DPP IV N-terminal domain-containing protein, partial [Acidobacteriota bacterium]|nr:DPP IV N-terminal domain-containing protein [Acidobacteriota bacterium]
MPLTRAAALLFSTVIVLPLTAVCLDAQPPRKPLTVEAIYAHGSLFGNPPNQVEWSPDGKHLTYIDSGEMMELDPGTGRTHVLIGRTKLAPLTREGGTEQDRDHRARYKMARYLWAPDSEHMLFDAGGQIWIYDLRSGTGLQVAYTAAAAGDDPKFSPDGKSISFIRAHSLVVEQLRVAGTPKTVVAPSQNHAVLNGEVDWVYEEELETRSNYFWSPDSKN